MFPVDLRMVNSHTKTNGNERRVSRKAAKAQRKNGFDGLKQVLPFLATLRLCLRPVVAVPLS
jgi:hypothetical protein